MVRLLWYEFRLLRRELTVVLVLFGLCLGLAGFNGFQRLNSLRQVQHELHQQEQERLTREVAKAGREQARLQAEGFPLSRYDKAARNPFKVAQKGALALLPPGPLAGLALGQSDLQPLATRVTLSPFSHLAREEQLQHPQALLLGPFDTAFVLVWLLPLLILALSFDILASEHESGMLRMLLSQPLSLSQLLAVKVLVRGGLIGGFTLLATATVALLQGVDLRAPGVLLRLGGVMAVSLAYAAFWFALALWVNSRPRPAVVQASRLALIWLAILFVIPASLNLILSLRYPLPSRVAFVQASNAAAEKVRNASAQALSRYFDDHPELGQGRHSEAEFNLLQLAREDLSGQEIAPVAGRFQQQLHAQQALLRRWQYLSPALVTQSALTELAGSSPERLLSYQMQLKAHHQQWRQWFVPRVRANQAVQVADYAVLPRFDWREPPARLPWLPLAFLTLLTLLLGVRAVSHFQRYPVVD